MTEQDLLELKDKIDEAKTELAEIQGQKKGLLSQLKNEFECDSIQDAEKEVQSLKLEIEKKDTQIFELTTEIEENYEV